MAASFSMADNFLARGGVGNFKRVNVKTRQLIDWGGESRIRLNVLNKTNFVNRELCNEQKKKKV